MTPDDRRTFDRGWWTGWISGMVLMVAGLFLLPGELSRRDVGLMAATGTIGMAIFAWLEKAARR